jgi:hypothetical protein
MDESSGSRDNRNQHRSGSQPGFQPIQPGDILGTTPPGRGSIQLRPRRVPTTPAIDGSASLSLYSRRQ